MPPHCRGFLKGGGYGAAYGFILGFGSVYCMLLSAALFGTPWPFIDGMGALFVPHAMGGLGMVVCGLLGFTFGSIYDLICTRDPFTIVAIVCMILLCVLIIPPCLIAYSSEVLPRE